MLTVSDKGLVAFLNNATQAAIVFHPDGRTTLALISWARTAGAMPRRAGCSQRARQLASRLIEIGAAPLDQTDNAYQMSDAFPSDRDTPMFRGLDVLPSRKEKLAVASPNIETPSPKVELKGISISLTGEELTINKQAARTRGHPGRSCQAVRRAQPFE